MLLHITQMCNVCPATHYISGKTASKSQQSSISLTFINFHSLEFREFKVQCACFNMHVNNKAKHA